jgi:5,10-methylene-tetrahydrofolate dehydrogenase/methenyl tetrahydrofolate cyclohydrolase
MFGVLTARHATVTLCHSRTRNLPAIVKNADLVVAALGVPQYIQGSWLKEGCVVIDVGINSIKGSLSLGVVSLVNAW